MNVLKYNNYHVPTDSIFYASVGKDECTVVLSASPVQLSFQLPGEEVRPVLEKAGFLCFAIICINPKNVSFLRETGMDIEVSGSFNRTVRVSGKDKIDRLLEAMFPQKRGK